MSPANAQQVATLDQIPPGKSLSVQVSGRHVALFNIDGALYAVDDECPHQGSPLADGFREGFEVTCPLHAWTFDVRDGRWCGTQTHPLACHRVHVDGDRVLIELQAAKD